MNVTPTDALRHCNRTLCIVSSIRYKDWVHKPEDLQVILTPALHHSGSGSFFPTPHSIVPVGLVLALELVCHSLPPGPVCLKSLHSSAHRSCQLDLTLPVTRRYPESDALLILTLHRLCYFPSLVHRSPCSASSCS